MTGNATALIIKEDKKARRKLASGDDAMFVCGEERNGRKMEEMRSIQS